MVKTMMHEQILARLGLVEAGGIDVRMGDVQVSSAQVSSSSVMEKNGGVVPKPPQRIMGPRGAAPTTPDEFAFLQRRLQDLEAEISALQGAGNETNMTLGVFKNIWICRAKQCTCEHGEPAVGLPCPKHEGPGCSRCDFGYSLWDNICKPMVVAVTRGHCDNIIIQNPAKQPPAHTWRVMLMPPQNQNSTIRHLWSTMSAKEVQGGFYRLHLDFIHDEDHCDEAGKRMGLPSGGPQATLRGFRAAWFPNAIPQDERSWPAQILDIRKTWQQVVPKLGILENKKFLQHIMHFSSTRRRSRQIASCSGAVNISEFCASMRRV